MHDRGRGKSWLAGAGVLASDLGKEQTRCGSLAYWLVVCSLVPLVLLVTILVCCRCALPPCLHLLASQDQSGGTWLAIQLRCLISK